MSVKVKDFVKMFTKEEILEALFNDREFGFARMQIRICRVLYEKKSDKLLAELEKTGENSVSKQLPSFRAMSLVMRSGSARTPMRECSAQ